MPTIRTNKTAHFTRDEVIAILLRELGLPAGTKVAGLFDAPQVDRRITLTWEEVEEVIPAAGLPQQGLGLSDEAPNPNHPWGGNSPTLPPPHEMWSNSVVITEPEDGQ